MQSLQKKNEKTRINKGFADSGLGVQIPFSLLESPHKQRVCGLFLFPCIQKGMQKSSKRKKGVSEWCQIFQNK